MSPSLETRLPRGTVLRDPILLASGCCGYGEEYLPIVHPASFGGVITKAVSVNPRLGNEAPRLRETPAGLLNCIGLQNPGVDVLLGEVLPRINQLGYSYIVNVVGHTVDEFAELVRRVQRHCEEQGQGGMIGFELDLSCPNVDSGTTFATDLDVLRAVTRACRAETEQLIVSKMTPNVTDMLPYAEASRESGADSITISNTLNGISIDIRTRKSNLGRPSAGLSGAAILPAVLYHIWRVHRAMKDYPIVGCGGIWDADSAIQHILAGATAIQLGTGLFMNPRLPLDVQQGLEKYLTEQNEPDLASIRGTYEYC
ncbi:MAG: dihydroorotate dehydrogenase [bacterium]